MLATKMMKRTKTTACAVALACAAGAANAGMYNLEMWLDSQIPVGQNMVINGASLLNVEVVTDTPFVTATLDISDAIDGTPNGFAPLRDIVVSPITLAGITYSLPGDLTRDQLLGLTDPNDWLGIRLDKNGVALRFDIPSASFSNAGSIVDDDAPGNFPQLTLIDENPDGSEAYVYDLTTGFALLTATQADLAGFVQTFTMAPTVLTPLGESVNLAYLGEWNTNVPGGNLRGILRLSPTGPVTPPDPGTVPLPGVLVLLGSGLVALVSSRRRLRGQD